LDSKSTIISVIIPGATVDQLREHQHFCDLDLHTYQAINPVSIDETMKGILQGLEHIL